MEVSNGLTLLMKLEAQRSPYVRDADLAAGQWCWTDNIITRLKGKGYLHLYKDNFGVWRFDLLNDSHALSLVSTVRPVIWIHKSAIVGGSNVPLLDRLHHEQN